MGLLNYTYKDIATKIRKKGWKVWRQGKGSHEIRFHIDHDEHIILPRHAGKTISKGVIKKIIQTLKLSNIEFSNI